MVATFILLTLAIIALWFPTDRPAASRTAGVDLIWGLPLATAIVAAWVSRILEWPGLLGILGFGATAWTFSTLTLGSAGRRVAGAILVLLAAALMAHQLPGFNNPRVIAGTAFGENAIPYRLHLNFDKPMVGIFLLAWCHELIRRSGEWRAMLMRVAPVTLGLIVAIMILSLAMGYVRFEPKFPREWWLWAWANLFLTCVAEEALFRAFVQAQLQRFWRDWRHGRWWALTVAAVLFGVAHAAGGVAYVILATIAGAGYGFAYLRTGRIEASILTHFALNATHFLLFTYPALARAP
jgi:uncharacterized protein